MILSRSTLAKMKVILNSMKAGQPGWERVSVVDVGEEKEDYRFVIILSLLIVNYLILASYNPLVCDLISATYSGQDRLHKTRKNNQPIYL